LEKKTINTSNRIKEYCSYLKIFEAMDSGRKEKRILEPSSGGMGTRLKIARAKFTITMMEVME
jgi:hypothetical protein